MGIKRVCDRCRKFSSSEKNTFYRVTLVVKKFHSETGNVNRDYYNEHEKYDVEKELCRNCFEIYDKAFKDFNLI